MNNEDDWSKTKWRLVSMRRILTFFFTNSVFSSAVNEQRRRLERQKIAACEHEEETYYFPCNNPIPGIAKQFIFLSKYYFLLSFKTKPKYENLI
jgi:hypothetical protein